MLSLFVLLNATVQTFLNSLYRDLAKKGFEIILVVVTSLWFTHPILLAFLFFSGKFSLPADPVFYLAWFGVVALAVAHVTLFVSGLERAQFLGANSFQSLSVAITVLYAFLFLGERLSILQMLALAVILLGVLLLFNWHTHSRILVRQNRGLELVLLSVFLTPLTSILYKLGALHTDSYYQFLSGRVIMDLLYWSGFLFLLFAFYFKRNPFSHAAVLIKERRGAAFIFLNGASALLESWLIFWLPISFVVMLGTISMPVSYFIGKFKYHDRMQFHHIAGSFFIILGIVIIGISGVIEL